MTSWFTSITDAEEPLQPGEQIGGKLAVLRKLGQGSMAVVYEAQHLQLGHRVAVKVLCSRGVDDHGYERFRREGRIASRIRSVHVPQIHDIGHLHDGKPYLVMELLEGETLHAIIQREGRLGIGMALEIARQLLAALDAAHRIGAVHRDVKPLNVFLCGTDEADPPVVKLVDFGISKSMDAAFPITQNGLIFGTPHYMAPEQAAGGRVDARSDVYSAGVVLYEMLTGKTPFSGDSAAAIASAALGEPFPAPSSRRFGCPDALDEAVLRAAAKLPHQRYPSARAMERALGRIAEELGLPIGRGAFASPSSWAHAVMDDASSEMVLLTRRKGMPMP